MKTTTHLDLRGVLRPRTHTRRACLPYWIAGIVMGFAVAASAPRLGAEDWPEWRGRGRTGVWTETGIIETFPAGGPPVKWRTKINAGYAGPSVADGRVFVTDSRRTTGNRAIERAVALDENTGAILWTREWETNYSGLQLVYAIGPRATPTGTARTNSRAASRSDPRGTSRRTRRKRRAAGSSAMSGLIRRAPHRCGRRRGGTFGANRCDSA